LAFFFWSGVLDIDGSGGNSSSLSVSITERDISMSNPESFTIDTYKTIS